jgi:hypothetical protein
MGEKKLSRNTRKMLRDQKKLSMDRKKDLKKLSMERKKALKDQKKQSMERKKAMKKLSTERKKALKAEKKSVKKEKIVVKKESKSKEKVVKREKQSKSKPKVIRKKQDLLSIISKEISMLQEYIQDAIKREERVPNKNHHKEHLACLRLLLTETIPEVSGMVQMEDFFLKKELQSVVVNMCWTKVEVLRAMFVEKTTALVEKVEDILRMFTHLALIVLKKRSINIVKDTKMQTILQRNTMFGAIAKLDFSGGYPAPKPVDEELCFDIFHTLGMIKPEVTTFDEMSSNDVEVFFTKFERYIKKNKNTGAQFDDCVIRLTKAANEKLGTHVNTVFTSIMEHVRKEQDVNGNKMVIVKTNYDSIWVPAIDEHNGKKPATNFHIAIFIELLHTQFQYLDGIISEKLFLDDSSTLLQVFIANRYTPDARKYFSTRYKVIGKTEAMLLSCSGVVAGALAKHLGWDGLKSGTFAIINLLKNSWHYLFNTFKASWNPLKWFSIPSEAMTFVKTFASPKLIKKCFKMAFDKILLIPAKDFRPVDLDDDLDISRLQRVAEEIGAIFSENQSMLNHQLIHLQSLVSFFQYVLYFILFMIVVFIVRKAYQLSVNWRIKRQAKKDAEKMLNVDIDQYKKNVRDEKVAVRSVMRVLHGDLNRKYAYNNPIVRIRTVTKSKKKSPSKK